MRFVFIVEGKTEMVSLQQFFERFLLGRGISGIRVDFRNRKTASAVFREAPQFACDLIGAPDSADIVAVYSLMDLFNAGIFPRKGMNVEERCDWATSDMHARYSDPRYRHFFAVFETEAWLLSDPDCFTDAMRNDLKSLKARPETVNDISGPADRIGDSYLKRHNRKYIKPEQGRTFFQKLDPEKAYQSCPTLRLLLDDMLYRCEHGGAAPPQPVPKLQIRPIRKIRLEGRGQNT
jgi:hypothetical protein